MIGGLLAMLAVLWLACSIDLRSHYLGVLRRRLDRRSLASLADYPELDVASLETMIAALDSADDRTLV